MIPSWKWRGGWSQACKNQRAGGFTSPIASELHIHTHLNENKEEEEILFSWMVVRCLLQCSKCFGVL